MYLQSGGAHQLSRTGKVLVCCTGGQGSIPGNVKIFQGIEMEMLAWTKVIRDFWKEVCRASWPLYQINYSKEWGTNIWLLKRGRRGAWSLLQAFIVAQMENPLSDVPATKGPHIAQIPVWGILGALGHFLYTFQSLPSVHIASMMMARIPISVIWNLCSWLRHCQHSNWTLVP